MIKHILTGQKCQILIAEHTDVPKVRFIIIIIIIRFVKRQNVKRLPWRYNLVHVESRTPKNRGEWAKKLYEQFYQHSLRPKPLGRLEDSRCGVKKFRGRT